MGRIWIRVRYEVWGLEVKLGMRHCWRCRKRESMTSFGRARPLWDKFLTSEVTAWLVDSFNHAFSDICLVLEAGNYSMQLAVKIGLLELFAWYSRFIVISTQTLVLLCCMMISNWPGLTTTAALLHCGNIALRCRWIVVLGMHDAIEVFRHLQDGW